MKAKLITKKSLLVIFATLCCCSCGDLRAQMQELLQIQQRISKQMGVKEVTMNIQNGKRINVSIINSTYNDSSDDVKQKVTNSIGVLCQKEAHSIKMTGGTVAFVNRASIGIASASSSTSFTMHLAK